MLLLRLVLLISSVLSASVVPYAMMPINTQEGVLIMALADAGTAVWLACRDCEAEDPLLSAAGNGSAGMQQLLQSGTP